ncbi:hypothetical protein CRM22_005483 [Opisthorchis felineus]|uniref:Uncharacterized protein n=1 Tax=Opisthorchis felineus TaxID=147828 RepID=A0A4S2LWP9_OPIFE|nr:hypothetical protein CRM22_005483 [Opisthorchis felineus]
MNFGNFLWAYPLTTEYHHVYFAPILNNLETRLLTHTLTTFYARKIWNSHVTEMRRLSILYVCLSIESFGFTRSAYFHNSSILSLSVYLYITSVSRTTVIKHHKYGLFYLLPNSPVLRSHILHHVRFFGCMDHEVPGMDLFLQLRTTHAEEWRSTGSFSIRVKMPQQNAFRKFLWRFAHHPTSRGADNTDLLDRTGSEFIPFSV